jgi:hypothetical protein
MDALHIFKGNSVLRDVQLSSSLSSVTRAE